MKRYTQSLPAGSGKIVEFVTGLQSKPSSTILGTFFRMVTFPQNTNTALQSGPSGSKLLIYGDSIAVGANATDWCNIGCITPGAQHWLGDIAHPAVFASALSAGQIASLAVVS